MDYVIAIPTYGRSNKIAEDTLAVLRRYGIPNGKIHLFVDNQKEFDDYTANVPRDLYGKIVITYKKGSISVIRNFIVDYFEENQKIISMDDDVKAFQTLDKKNNLVDLASLTALIEKGFALCAEHKCSLWGVYPVANGYYMKSNKEYSTDLKFIVGSFMAFTNRKIKCRMNFKEDYELSIENFLRDHKVVRFNRVCIKFKMYSKNGGIGKSQEERLQDNIRAAKWLLQKYPKWVKLNARREGEVLLNKRDMTQQLNKKNIKTRSNKDLILN